jgi:hypothetical protein
MATWHRCWRCKIRIPYLDEQEWALIHPLLSAYTKAIQAHREETGASLAQSLEHVRSDACAKFMDITGFTETNVDAIWHHRRTVYGAPCTHCGDQLRTPRSRRCFSCGTPVNDSGGFAGHPA